ncbi:unnamed protein product [Brassica oleracea]
MNKGCRTRGMPRRKVDEHPSPALFIHRFSITGDDFHCNRNMLINF